MKKIKYNSKEGQQIISFYIMALNADLEGENAAYDKKEAEYDSYDNELKSKVDYLFDCI